MPHVEAQTRINRPVDEVFDYLADMRNETNWNPTLLRIEKTSSGDVQAGTTFVGAWRGIGSVDMVIVDYARPRRFTMQGESRAMRMAPEFAFTPGDGGTVVTTRMDVQPRGIFRVMAPFMGMMMRRQMANSMAHLKRVLEAGSATATSRPT